MRVIVPLLKKNFVSDKTNPAAVGLDTASAEKDTLRCGA
jgi:hypothetical protein